jgi:hypothetical protein
MARGKKIMLDLTPQGAIEESRNLKLIYDKYADLDQYDYKMVKALCRSVLAGKRTTGQATVRTLVGVVCGLAPDLEKVDANTDSRLKKLALHSLIMLNEQALAKFIPNLHDVFWSDKTDDSLKLGVGLLLISQNQETKLVVEWFLQNLSNDEVWESAYYNAFTGDLYFEGRSIGFVGLDAVFDEHLADIMDNANAVKLKRVLTNNDYLDSSLRQLILNHNASGFEALMSTVVSNMTEKNIDMYCDIAREVNGWSSKCEDDINDLLAQKLGYRFYPGYATLEQDQQMYDMISKADSNNLGYSFKQYLNMLARTYLNLPDDENDYYPDVAETKSSIKNMMMGYKQALRQHPKYTRDYLRAIMMVENAERTNFN